MAASPSRRVTSVCHRRIEVQVGLGAMAGQAP
jgi:hypothetical protein